MFEHLDDPNPPPPRQLLVELVVAEGARRRRRRAAIAGGAAAMLLVLAGGVRLAQVAGSGADLDVEMETPPAESPDSRGEGRESGDDVATTPGPGDSATGSTQSTDGGASALPEATAFAGITTDDEIVLGDISLDGAVERVLVATPTDGTELGTQVALSPDRQTVYYEATPTTGDEAGESAIFEVSTTSGEGPTTIDEGTSPAISHDGKQLAYVQQGEDGASIVVRDVSGDEPTPEQQVRRYVGPADDDRTISDLAFTADGESVVFAWAPADGGAAPLYILDLNFSISVSAGLGDASELGPLGEAEGTTWSSPDARVTDPERDEGTIGVVQRCCALESDSETVFAFVAPASGQRPEDQPADGLSGQVVRATYDFSGQNQLVLTADESGGTDGLYLRQGDGPLERLGEGAQYRAIDW